MRTPDLNHNNDVAQTTIDRIASELRLLEGRLQNLEDGLAMFLREKPESKTLTAMQEVDAILQSTISLANYLDALSLDKHQGRKTHAKRALNKMPLRDMASRLSGGATEIPKSGTPELF